MVQLLHDFILRSFLDSKCFSLGLSSLPSYLFILDTVWGMEWEELLFFMLFTLIEKKKKARQCLQFKRVIVPFERGSQMLDSVPALTWAIPP